MDDTIYRQAAIDALGRVDMVTDTWCDEYALGQRDLWIKTKKALEELPSAQQTTCKYWDMESDFCALYRPSAQPEQRWIPCSEPPGDDENVFIAHGTENFMTCCIGHYDHESGLWYEDRNWFAKPIFDNMYWCEMPILPKTEE